MSLQPLMNLVIIKERKVCLKINKKINFLGILGQKFDESTEIFFDLYSERFILKSTKEMLVMIYKVII